MDRIHTALRFSEWALEFMIVPPICFAFVLVAISFVWAAQKQRPFQTRLWKPHHWLALTHLLFFPVAIIVGVIGGNPVTNPTIPHSASQTAKLYLDVVTYGSLASCGFWIWRMKGFRWYATSLMALAELVTWGALFVAGMSITGDWL
jgi:hypothetical protein